jgi:glycosyltransferase involved in cell wall biosynthesis
MKRIVVLASGPLCRHPRLAKEASALGSAGFDVTVLTVAYTASDEAMDEDIVRGAPFRKVAVDLVLRPTPAAQLRRFARRGAAYVARRMVSTRFLNAHALGPATALARAARRMPWDLLIAHTELPMAIAARFLAEGRPVAVDIEDWHSRDLLAEAALRRPIPYLRAVEGALLRGALSVTTTSEAMAGALQAAYGGRRPVAIRNLFPLQPASELVRAPGEPSLLWFSQTVGPGRGLEEFLRGWGLSRSRSRLAILGKAGDTYRDHLASLAPAGRRAALSFVPVVPPDALPRVIAGHHVGLALEPLVPDNKDLTISNKIFQYFNAGLCVLATDTAGQREAAVRAPGAVQFIDLSDPAGMAAAIDALLAAPERVASMGRAARRAAESELCWEREAPRLVSAIQDAFARVPAP